MKTQTTSQIINTIKVITLALLLALGISYVSAQWSGPQQAPPLGNVSAPLNTGATAQTKTGSLAVGSLTVKGSVPDYSSGINFQDSNSAPVAGLFANLAAGGFLKPANGTYPWYVFLDSGSTVQTGMIRAPYIQISSRSTAGGVPVVGDVLTAQDTSGTAAWNTPSGGGGGVTDLCNIATGSAVGTDALCVAHCTGSAPGVWRLIGSWDADQGGDMAYGRGRTSGRTPSGISGIYPWFNTLCAKFN